MVQKTITLNHVSSQILNEKMDHPLWKVYDKDASVSRFYSYKEDYDACYELIDAGYPITQTLIDKQEFELPDKAPYYLSITTAKSSDYILKGSTGTKLQFKWETKSGETGMPLQGGERVQATITFTNGGSSQQVKNTFAPTDYDESGYISMLIDEYLRDGENAVSISLYGMTSKQTSNITVYYYVIAMGISSSFNIAQSLTAVNSLLAFNVPYKEWGAYDKTVQVYLDNSASAIEASYSASHNPTSDNPSEDETSVTLSNPAAGLHYLQIRQKVVFNNNPFYSKVLYYEYCVTGALTKSVVMISAELDTLLTSGATIKFSGEQYNPVKVNWAYYDKDGSTTSKEVTWTITSPTGSQTTVKQKASTYSATNNVLPEPITFLPEEQGTYTLTCVVDGVTLRTLEVVVVKNTHGIEKATSGLMLELSAMSRSENEPADIHNRWAYGSWETTFHGTHRWENGACVLENKAWIEIKSASSELLNNEAESRGFSFEVCYETFSMDDENASVLKLGKTGEGLINITAKKASITSAFGTSINTEFNLQEKQFKAFIISPKKNTSEPRVIYIQSDGVKERGVSYVDADSFTSKESLIIGNAEGKCGIKIYSIRAYRTALSSDAEAMNYFISLDSDKVASVLEKNNILSGGVISLAEFEKRNIDIYKVDGNIPSLFNNIDDVKLKVDFEREGADPYTNFKVTKGRLSNPGQSTRGYGISQQRIYTDKDGCTIVDYTGNAPAKNNIQLESGGIPEKKARLNPQYVDSSYAIAATFFRMENWTSPNVQINDTELLAACGVTNKYILRTGAQHYVLSGQWAEDMATEFGGKAEDYVWPYKTDYSDCAILNVPSSTIGVEFWRNSQSAAYSFLCPMTFSHEKKSPRTWGYKKIYLKKLADGTPDPFDIYEGSKGTVGYDPSNVMQFEILQNADADICPFQDNTNWNTARYDEQGKYLGTASEQVFEQEFPDTDDSDHQTDPTTGEEVGGVKIYGLTKTGTAAADATVGEKWFTADFRNHFKQSLFDWFVTCYKVDNGGSGAKTKFQTEAKNHLDLPKWAAYYIKLIKHMMVDNMVRNIELVTEDGIRWYPKFWDVDVQWGIRNDGPIVFSPGIDRNSLDPTSTTGAHAFAGYGYWLWDAFTTWDWFMQTLVPAVNNAIVAAGWTRENFLTRLDTFLSIVPERAYNAAMQSKYIDQHFNDGKDYLPYMKGKMKAYLHYTVAESFEKWDQMWASGDYVRKTIRLTASGTQKGAKMYFKAAKDAIFGWALTDTTRIQQSGFDKKKGDTFYFTTQSGLSGNDPVYLFAPNAYEVIDLHEIAKYITTADFSACFDSDLGTNIKQLLIGIDYDGTDAITVRGAELSNLSGLDKMTRLTHLNVQGLTFKSKAVDNLDKLTALTHFYAKGSNIVSFEPATNINLNTIQLPACTRSIKMTGCTWQTLDFFDDTNLTKLTSIPSTLTSLKLYNVGSNTNARTLVSGWCTMLAQQASTLGYELEITSVNWTMSIANLMAMTALEAGKRQVTGTITLTETPTSVQIAAIKAAFGDVFDLSNPLVVNCPAGLLVGIDTTKQGISMADDGSVTILAGSETSLTATVFPQRAGATANVVYGMKIGDTYVNARNGYTKDSNGYWHVDNVFVHPSTGVVKTTETSKVTWSLQFIVYDMDNAGQEYPINVSVQKRTYPTKETIVSVDGMQKDQNGDYSLQGTGHFKFRVNYTPESFNGHNSQQPAWTLTTDVASNKMASDTTDVSDITKEFCLNVIESPEDNYRATLKHISNWWGASQTRDIISIVVYNNVTNVLISSDGLGGNSLLCAILNTIANSTWSADTQRALTASFSSANLRMFTGTLNLSGKQFASFVGSDSYQNILVFLKYVTTLNCSNCTSLSVINIGVMTWVEGVNLSGCTSLTGDIDITALTAIKSLDLSGTSTRNVTGVSGKVLTSIKYHAPTAISITNCPNLTMANIAAEWDGTVPTETEVNE